MVLSGLAIAKVLLVFFLRSQLVNMDSYNFGVLSLTNLELLQKSRDTHRENAQANELFYMSCFISSY